MEVVEAVVGYSETTTMETASSGPTLYPAAYLIRRPSEDRVPAGAAGDSLQHALRNLSNHCDPRVTARGRDHFLFRVNKRVLKL